MTQEQLDRINRNATLNKADVIHRLLSLKRYEAECSCGQYSFKTLELSNDGNVVKWEDIEAFINELKSN